MGQHTVADSQESVANGQADATPEGSPDATPEGPPDARRAGSPDATRPDTREATPDRRPDETPDALGSQVSAGHQTAPAPGLRAVVTEALATGLFRTAKWAADELTETAIRLHERTRFADVGRGSYNAIVSFHAVGADPALDLRESVSPDRFRQTLERVRADAEFVPLSAITTPSRRQRVAVTFDDGLQSVYENALPVLRDLGVPATVFLNPGLLDDRDPGLFAARHGATRGEGLTLTDAQVRELVAEPLVSIGNHTTTHRDLTAIDDSVILRDEVVESRRLLERRYDADVAAFAYPYGAYDDRSKRLVEETHDVSVTTSPLLVGRRRPPHNLPRLSGTDPLPTLSWELTPASDVLHRLRQPWRDTSVGPGDLG